MPSHISRRHCSDDQGPRSGCKQKGPFENSMAVFLISHPQVDAPHATAHSNNARLLLMKNTFFQHKDLHKYI